MARALSAYLKRDAVPARQALQQAIRDLKFPLSLDETYAPLETAGYLPCTLDGEDAGFDLRFKAVPDDLTTLPNIKTQLDGRDMIMALKWSGDPREAAAAAAVCAALAKEFGALVQDGDSDTLVSPAALLERAKAALD